MMRLSIVFDRRGDRAGRVRRRGLTGRASADSDDRIRCGFDTDGHHRLSASGSTVTMEATDFSTTVADSDFTLPATVR